MALFIAEDTDSTFVVRPGENTLQAAASALTAEGWADASALSAATAEAAAGPTYASTAAGLAATTSGEAFAVDAGGGLVSVYLNSSGTAVLQRTLATTGALAASGGSALVGFLQSGTGATARTVQAKLRDTVSVKDFGAVGDGVTDDSAAIQAAIDYASSLGGGTIFFPIGEYRCNVVLKANVTLTSLSTGAFGYLPGGLKGVVLKQAAAGFVVDTPATGIGPCAVVGINFKGLGAGTAGGGVRFQNVSWGAVKQCQFDNFADQAVLKNAGNANTFEDILTTNVLLNRTRAAVNGAIELAGGADDFLSRIEATPSLTSGVSDANLRVCALVIKAANVFASNCIGEFADYGIYTTGNHCRLVNCRADLNKGGGFYCGGSSLYSNCLSLSNGQAAANTYDGFHVVGQGDSFANCSSSNLTSTVRYGFYDTANFAAVSSRNKYVNCTAANYGTGAFYTEGFLGSSPIEPGIPLRDGTAIPDTTGTTFVVLTAAAPLTITNFTGGYSGKTIRLLGNANVTVKNNATIKTNTGADKLLAANKVYTFTNYNGVWYENAQPSVTITCAAGLGAGFSCTIIQGCAGKVTVADGGQTLVSYSSLFSTMGQYAVISAICPVANTFLLAGNLV